MFDTIASFEPQHTFLIQGTSVLFDTYIDELNTRSCSVYAKALPRFTVDDAADVRDFITEDTGEVRYCVVYFSAFSPDAAEILLKTLEEPPIDARIIVITPYPYLVPQTIRSRVRVDTTIHTKIRGEVFDKKNIAEHLKVALGDEKEEAAIRRERALFFLDNLEYSVRADHQKCTLVYEAKDLLLKGNLPSKQVLEYLTTVVF